MSGVFTPELNHVKLESPTEDGKLAYVMNTMVPRRLDQFDDIKNDLANKNFNIDKAFLYVNFQAGDFCGRSYKIPLSELNEFTVRSLLFGVNGKDPVMKFDKNFYIDEDNGIHLIIDSGDPPYIVDEDSMGKLQKKFAWLNNDIMQANERISEEISRAVKKEDELERQKADKFIILGSGDKLNSEGMPVPKPRTASDPFGVHVTVNPKDAHGDPIYEGPDLGDGTKGPVILIDHDEVVPKGG